MRVNGGVVLALAMAAACGDNAPGTPPPRDGTRLRLTWFTFEDGQTLSRADNGTDDYLTDVALGTTCRPQPFTDGKIYCSPVDTDVIVYLDEDCEQPAALDSGHTFAADAKRTCGTSTPRALYQRTAAASLQQYWTGEPDGFCLAHGEGVVAPVKRVMPVELEMHRSGGAGVQSEWLTSSDGLAVAAGLFDPVLDEHCWLTPLDGVFASQCVPRDVAEAAFTNASCTSEEAAEGYAGCAPPPVAYRDGSSTCGEYFDVGKEIGTAYRNDFDTCVESGSDRAAFELGEPLRVASLYRAVDPNDSHRIRPIYIKPAGALEALRVPDPDNFYDAQLEAECVMTLTADRDEVCAPQPHAFVDYAYSDAACTDPRRVIVDLDDELDPCEERTPGRYADDTDFSVDPPVTVTRAIGPLIAEPIYGFDGGCQRVRAARYELGGILRESELAHATTRNPLR